MSAQSGHQLPRMSCSGRAQRAWVIMTAARMSVGGVFPVPAHPHDEIRSHYNFDKASSRFLASFANSFLGCFSAMKV